MPFISCRSEVTRICFISEVVDTLSVADTVQQAKQPNYLAAGQIPMYPCNLNLTSYIKHPTLTSNVSNKEWRRDSRLFRANPSPFP
eukprot:51605-Pelagomonas_calceolata.AAC.2